MSADCVCKCELTDIHGKIAVGHQGNAQSETHPTEVRHHTHHLSFSNEVLPTSYSPVAADHLNVSERKRHQQTRRLQAGADGGCDFTEFIERWM